MRKLSLKKQIDLVFEEYQSDLVRCEEELKRLLKEAERADDFYSIGKINLRLSMCIFRQGKRKNMLACAYIAVNIFNNTTDHALLARSYNMMGIAYASQGCFQSAISAYQKALFTIHRKKKPGLSKQLLMNNIGDAYYHMGAYKESLRIALECFSCCKKDEPDNHRVMTLYGMNIYDNYCGLGDYKKANAYLDQVEPNALRLDKNNIICGFYTRRANVLYATGDVDGGAEYADRVIELVRSHCDTYEIHYFFEQIASYQIEQGDLKRAQCFCDVLLNYAAENNHTLDQIIAKRVQAKICIAKEEKIQALALFRELNGLYEKRTQEFHLMQYESQKDIERVNREIVKMMERLCLNQEKAQHDPLTGLMNRSALVRITNAFIQQAKTWSQKLGGIFFDIDFFKEFNDTYGHAEGDEAIKLIARICLEEENSAVKFFRYGGDEFFGIALGYCDEDLESLSLRISEKVRASGVVHAENPNGKHLTVSIGIVNLDMKASNDTILDIIQYADHALYHAKNHGKDCVFAYQFTTQYSEPNFKRITSN